MLSAWVLRNVVMCRQTTHDGPAGCRAAGGKGVAGPIARRAVLAAALLPLAARAQAAPLAIGYLSLRVPRPVASTLIEPPPADEGVQGARLGLADNATTGRFTGQAFTLDERRTEEPEAALEALRGLLASGIRAGCRRPAGGAAAAGRGRAGGAAAEHRRPRRRPARRRMPRQHPAPAAEPRHAGRRAGAVPGGEALAQTCCSWSGRRRATAYCRRRPARGAEIRLRIVLDKPWTLEPGAQRTDTGHFSIAAEVARFTQGVRYDVLVVADEDGTFGDEPGLAHHRPAAGGRDAGPGADCLGADPRAMGCDAIAAPLPHAGRPVDDAATTPPGWRCGRSAKPRRAPNPPTPPRSPPFAQPAFELAAFKGARLTFRSWDGQLRQPVLLADAARAGLGVPAAGLPAPVSELDTLGIDRPETQCRAP